MLFLLFSGMNSFTICRLNSFLRCILRSCSFRGSLSYLLLLSLVLHNRSFDALRYRMLLHNMMLSTATFSHFEFLLVKLLFEGSLFLEKNLHHVCKLVDLLVFEIVPRVFIRNRGYFCWILEI
jgi:hypothetical protein